MSHEVESSSTKSNSMAISPTGFHERFARLVLLVNVEASAIASNEKGLAL